MADLSLTDRQKAALKKLQLLSDPHPPTNLKTKANSVTAISDEPISADSPTIDLETETIQKKRERQRSLVLNLGKQSLLTDARQSRFFRSHHSDSSIVVVGTLAIVPDGPRDHLHERKGRRNEYQRRQGHRLRCSLR